MKVAFWALGIFILSLFGLIIVNLFGNITVTDQLNYVSMKNAVEASMYDALDVPHYRTGFCLCTNKEKAGGVWKFESESEYEISDIVFKNINLPLTEEEESKIKYVNKYEGCKTTLNNCEILHNEYMINERAFAESLLRRFAELINNNKDYEFIIQDVVKYPPKVSVRVNSKDKDMSPIEENPTGFTIVNQMDAIIETTKGEKEEHPYMGCFTSGGYYEYGSSSDHSGWEYLSGYSKSDCHPPATSSPSPTPSPTPEEIHTIKIYHKRQLGTIRGQHVDDPSYWNVIVYPIGKSFDKVETSKSINFEIGNNDKLCPKDSSELRSPLFEWDKERPFYTEADFEPGTFEMDSNGCISGKLKKDTTIIFKYVKSPVSVYKVTVQHRKVNSLGVEGKICNSYTIKREGQKIVVEPCGVNDYINENDKGKYEYSKEYKVEKAVIEENEEINYKAIKNITADENGKIIIDDGGLTDPKDANIRITYMYKLNKVKIYHYAIERKYGTLFEKTKSKVADVETKIFDENSNLEVNYKATSEFSDEKYRGESGPGGYYTWEITYYKDKNNNMVVWKQRGNNNVKFDINEIIDNVDISKTIEIYHYYIPHFIRIHHYELDTEQSNIDKGIFVAKESQNSDGTTGGPINVGPVGLYGYYINKDNQKVFLDYNVKFAVDELAESFKCTSCDENAYTSGTCPCEDYGTAKLCEAFRNYEYVGMSYDNSDGIIYGTIGNTDFKQNDFNGYLEEVIFYYKPKSKSTGTCNWHYTGNLKCVDKNGNIQTVYYTGGNGSIKCSIAQDACEKKLKSKTERDKICQNSGYVVATNDYSCAAAGRRTLRLKENQPNTCTTYLTQYCDGNIVPPRVLQCSYSCIN